MRVEEYCILNDEPFRQFWQLKEKFSGGHPRQFPPRFPSKLASFWEHTSVGKRFEVLVYHPRSEQEAK